MGWIPFVLQQIEGPFNLSGREPHPLVVIGVEVEHPVALAMAALKASMNSANTRRAAY
jgi:hypothetical protein